MALHEERNEQKQRKWLSRLARERRDLSASVEATLLDTVLQEQRGQGEVEEQESSVHLAQGTTLIPPRLSLQSKMMTAIQPGSFVDDANRAHTSVASVRTGEEAKSSSASVTAQNANMLARFAQRITTSLAAFGTAMHPEVFPPSLIDDQEEQQEKPGEELLTVSQQAPLVSAAPVPQRPEMTGTGNTGQSPVIQAPTEVAQTGQIAQSRQRLAGRTGKIRLETAVLPVPQPVEKREESQQLEKSSGATAADLIAVNAGAAEINATSARLPAMGKKLVESSGTTSARLPALDKYKGEVGAAARGALSGSGMIECGQQEVIVVNKYVSTSSVVLVMLTKDPGPVVVQYISLQPQVGFTIHLTAPAAMKASFNYVVLLGELF